MTPLEKAYYDGWKDCHKLVKKTMIEELKNLIKKIKGER